jgi:hypothetical protein
MKWLRANWPSVLLLAAIWLVFECWISWAAFCDHPPHQAGSYETPKEYPCQFRGPFLFAAQRLVGWWRHSFDDAESYIALFTAILAFGTITLWLATRRLVQGADKTAERQLRAYVHLKNFDVREIMNPWGVKGIHDTTPTLFLTWENTGQTPTRSALSNSNWASFEGDIPSDFQFPDDPEHGPFPGLLGPGQFQELNPRPIPIDVLKAADARKVRIYVWGWIEYNDVFVGTRRHRTEFSARLEVRGLPGRQCFYGLRIYPKHNGADDECMKPVQTRYK